MRICLLLAMLFAAWPVAAEAPLAEPLVVSWPQSMLDDRRGHYPIELLQLALDKAGGRFRAVPSRRDLSQSRTLRELELDRGVQVAWTFSTPERERVLKPIRIPIDRGLLGWRLLLVPAQPGSAASIPDVAALKRLHLAQGHDWPDLTVLRHNGFRASAGSSYEGLFEMLLRGRVDAFPRSLSEIQAELAARPQQALAIAPEWVLVYPAPSYFFVSRRRSELALEIERGLRLALADGSMVALFRSHFGREIDQAGLAHRRILRLHNPNLSVETPLADSSLWFDPERGY